MAESRQPAVEVVVAYALEHGHGHARDRPRIVVEQPHVVEHQVAEGHAHHLAATAERGHRAPQAGHGLAAPTGHVGGIAHLRVGYGHIIKAVGRHRAALEHETPAAAGHRPAHGHEKAGSQAAILREPEACRRRDTHKLTPERIGDQGPSPVGAGERKPHPVVYHYAADAAPLGVDHHPRQPENILPRHASAHQDQACKQQQQSPCLHIHPFHHHNAQGPPPALGHGKGSTTPLRRRCKGLMFALRERCNGVTARGAAPSAEQ